LIPNVLAAAEEGRELTLFGDDYPTPDRTCVRDYVHVEDVASAHLLALVATDRNDPRTGPANGPCQPLICNLGSGTGFSKPADRGGRGGCGGTPDRGEDGPRRPGDPPVLVASAERAARELGWQPRLGRIEEIVGTAWKWRRDNPNGYAE